MGKYKEKKQKNRWPNLSLFLCPNMYRSVYGNNIESSIDVTQKTLQNLCGNSVENYRDKEVM